MPGLNSINHDPGHTQYRDMSKGYFLIPIDGRTEAKCHGNFKPKKEDNGRPDLQPSTIPHVATS